MRVSFDDCLTWTEKCEKTEKELRSFYPELKDWEVENIMLKAEVTPIITYKDFYANLYD